MELDASKAYLECSKAHPESNEGLLTCLLSATATTHANQDDQDKIQANYNRIYTITVLFCAAMVFFMQAGFAMICAGAVRRKNLQNTMLKNFLDACGASIAFCSVGYAFAYGGGRSAFIGTTNFFLQGVENTALFFFQYSLTAAAATIVAGTLSERCQMSAYFTYSLLISGFVYPVCAHSIWSDDGFFSATHEDPLYGVGVVDIGGSGVVHAVGGIAALIAAYVLGPRRGRFHDEQSGETLAVPKTIKGHNIGLQLLGTLILWFGWYGFNGGSAFLYGGAEYGDILMALSAANTTLAGGTAGVVALFTEYYAAASTNKRKGSHGNSSSSNSNSNTASNKKFDLVKAMNGVLGGLVAITAGCSLVETWAAVLIGGVAGVLYLFGSTLLISLRLDDAVDAIPVHFVNGIWGMISVGLFATPEGMDQSFGNGGEHPGLLYRNSEGKISFNLFKAQIVGSLFLMAWVIGTMMPFFIALDWFGLFRVDPRQEVSGLDKFFCSQGLYDDDEDIDGGMTRHQLDMIALEVSSQIGSTSRHGRRRRGGLKNAQDVNGSTKSFDSFAL